MNKDKIVFRGYEIQNFIYNKEEIETVNKGNLVISQKVLHNCKKNKDSSYCLVMNLKMLTDNAKIDITVNSYFEVPSKVDNDVKNYFFNVSAPAIVYPYIRAFISNITALDNGKTVILPIVNFAEIKMQNQNQDVEEKNSD